MKTWAGAEAPTPVPPAILVVDDDRRVVELLQIALTAHGFRVLTAADGEEAHRRAVVERPDLLVLDVRLPKRSGLEVCEMLRQDAEDPHVPIIMVSAASETEARLQGLARGADDYLVKPFSPKELIARIKRLLARAAEGREARRKSQEAEREVSRLREDLKRSHLDLCREKRLRDLTAQLARDLHRVLDPDELAGRFLLAVQAQIGVEVAALVWRRPGAARLEPMAIRGRGFDRFAELELPADGELSALLAGLGRPATRHELERFPELAPELPPLVAHGFTLAAPLVDREGLIGLLLTDERADGDALSALDVEVLGLLCEATAIALRNALRCREQADALIAQLAARAAESGDPAQALAREEAAAFAERSARALGLPARERGLLLHGVALGTWAQVEPGRSLLAGVAAVDATGRGELLQQLLESAADPVFDVGSGDPDRASTTLLLAVALRFAAARAERASVEDALAHAAGALGPALEPAWRPVLESAVAERRAFARTS